MWKFDRYLVSVASIFSPVHTLAMCNRSTTPPPSHSPLTRGEITLPASRDKRLLSTWSPRSKGKKRGIFYRRARTLGCMIATIWHRRHEWNWLRVLSNFFSIIPTRSVFKKRCKIKLGLKREGHVRDQRDIVEFFHLVGSRSWQKVWCTCRVVVLLINPIQ